METAIHIPGGPSIAMIRANDMNILRLHAHDILSSEGMQREKQFTQHGGTRCYDHSVAVACMSVRLARRLRIRVELRSLVRGALLHDYFLYDWRDADPEHRLHGFRHARRALRNAEQDFALTRIERDIILRHMFPLNPRPPRYRESMIVTVADKLCAMQELWGYARRSVGLRPAAQHS